MPDGNQSRPSIAEELEHLAELLRKGTLSAEEYAEAKSAVLSGQRTRAAKPGWFVSIGGYIQIALALIALLLLIIFIIMVFSGYRFGIPVTPAWN
jgi:hypothetical protein